MRTLALAALLLPLGAGAAPLTLDDALALAARRNPDLTIARADADAAAADARAAYAGVLPRLDVSGGLGHQWLGEQEQVNVIPNPTPPPDFVREAVTFPANDFGAHNLGAVVSWTLFDGLASWKAISATRTRTAAARRLFDESTLRVAFEVTRRFYEVVKQQRALEVRQQTAALSRELVQRADALFTAGRGTKADTFAARVNLGNDEIAVNAQEAILARARADLATILGLASAEGLEIVPPEATAPGRPQDVRHPPPLADLLAHARKGRPLVAARKLEGEAAYDEVARARGAYWPVLGLQGSYQKQATELTGSTGIFGSPGNQYVAVGQVTIAWNLFAGGETRAAVQRAGALAQRAQALLEQGEQATAAEVMVAREQVVALADSFATVQQIQEASDQSLRFSREQLEAGVGSQLQVRDAALKVTQARLTWVDTVVDLVVARADLNRAVGGSL
jgi:outer membrane protein TolC